MPNKHKMPAKPKPQAGGMKLANAMPTKLATIQPLQFKQSLPAK